MSDYQPITGPLPLTPEWYEARFSGFGASEAAAVCGLNEYKSPLDIYLLKRRIVEPEDENDRMRLGKKLEPVCISEYEHATQLVVQYPQPLFRRPDLPFIFASPDGLVITPELWPWKVERGLECKATNWRQARRLGEEGTDFIFDPWLLQCQQCMYVTGATLWDLAVLIDGFEVRVFTIQRNEDLIAGIVDAETELWERIQNIDPPPPNWTHPRTPDLVKEMHGVEGLVRGLTLNLSDRAQHAWALKGHLAKRRLHLEKIEKSLEALVRLEIGDAEFGALPSGMRIKRTSVNVPESVRAAYSFTRLYEQAAKEEPALPAPNGKPKRKPSLLTERKALLALDNHCHWCGQELTLRSSHIGPIVQGRDEDDFNNLALACAKCTKERSTGLIPLATEQ